MTNQTENTTEKWRTALDTKLSGIKENEICISYSKVSLAFPGGPHSKSFDIEVIDSTTLKKWTKNLGWNVTLDTKTQQDFPDVIFTRISQETR